MPPKHHASVGSAFAKLCVAADCAEQRYELAISRTHSLLCNGFVLVYNEMRGINHSSITFISAVLYFNKHAHVCLFLITQ